MTLIEVLERRQLLAAQYSLQILAPTTGATSSHATALNESGKVVGYSGPSASATPTAWSGGTPSSIPLDELGDRIANDINENGDILFDRYVRGSDGKYRVLYVGFNTPYSATALNNKGDAVGTINYLDKPIVWFKDKPDQYTYFTTVYDGVAKDINDDQTVVGYVTTDDGTIPFLYSFANKQFRQLPIPAADKPDAVANTINAPGDAAGYITIDDKGTKHAVTWVGGLMQSLPALDGSNYSIANAMNDNGDVVGNAKVNGSDTPFIYRDGSMLNLNSIVNLPSGTTLRAAVDINNKGQIVGYADTPSGQRAFILSKLGTSSIAGAVYVDNDADGIKDSGEPALKGTKVFIDADKDGVLDTGEITAIADSSGNYKFGSLSSGTYRVRQVSTAGYRPTNPSSNYYDITVGSGSNITGKNFGNTQKVLITGTVWKDADADGVKDSNETGLSGWRVFIDKDKDGIFDSGESSVVTDSSGNYTFKTLAAGSYRVREVLPANWRRTAPSSGYYDLTLGNGATASSKNFGNTQNVLITGSVFKDLDKDKTKDANEGGLSSWRVFIDKDNDGIFDAGEASVLTNSSGSYTFKALGAGTYVIRVVAQSGWTRTTPTGSSINVTLGAGATASGKNFGYVQVV